jgi:hypothetical protein
VDFRIVLNVDGTVMATNYGPIEIHSAYQDLKVMDTGGPVSDPQAVLGQQLFGSYCVTCHLANIPPRTTTVAKIRSAMSSVPAMKAATNIKGLTDTQLTAITKFLGSQR